MRGIERSGTKEVMKNVNGASEEVKISEKFEFQLSWEILQSELNELTDLTCERLVLRASFFCPERRFVIFQQCELKIY